MFLLTWPIDLAHSGVVPIKVPCVVYTTLAWGFIWVSLILAGLTLGRGAVGALLKRFRLWRVSWTWSLVAAPLFPAIFLGAVLLNAAWTRTAVDFSTIFAHQIFGLSANLPLFILPYFLFDVLTNGEEMGSRGYVLPRLQAKHGALVSSLIRPVATTVAGSHTNVLMVAIVLEILAATAVTVLAGPARLSQGMVAQALA